MSSNKSNKKTSKKKNSDLRLISCLKLKLLEGTALKNVKKLEGKGKTAIFVKNWHLEYEQELKCLQIELMKLQRHMQRNGDRMLMIFEGRDAAGKGGTIKRITANLNPRNTRVVALTKPNETETSQWYFQRYTPHLPAAGEMVLFDRSWYNRAMVEPVMRFCTDEQNKRFLKDVPMLEEMLVKDGIHLLNSIFPYQKRSRRNVLTQEKKIHSNSINSPQWIILRRSTGMNTPFGNFKCYLKQIEPCPPGQLSVLT